jgi:hypothetical protein
MISNSTVRCDWLLGNGGDCCWGYLWLGGGLCDVLHAFSSTVSISRDRVICGLRAGCVTFCVLLAQ